MKQKIKDLSLKDFSELVGSNVIDLPKETREEFKKYDFRYRELTTEERDRAILKMIKKIISTMFCLISDLTGRPFFMARDMFYLFI